MSDTVYFVTKGEYADYSIVGVFTSRERAEKYAELLDNSWARTRVEEFPLNPNEEELHAGKKPFFIRMTKDGEVLDSWIRIGWSDSLEFDIENNLITTVWADDLMHAAKIVNEKRTQLIASNEWPEEKK